MHHQLKLGLPTSATLEEHFLQRLEQACQQLQVFCGYYSGLPMGRSRLFRFRLGASCVVPMEAKAVLQQNQSPFHPIQSNLHQV